MYYKIEIYDRQSELKYTSDGDDEAKVYQEYAQFLEYYWKYKQKYSSTIKKVLVRKKPYTEGVWEGYAIFDDGVIYSKYKYYFDLN